MTDRMKKAAQFAYEATRESARQKRSDHDENRHRQGFRASASITLRHIDTRLDALIEQMKGQGLTKAEQAIYAELEQLKRDIEEACDRYWGGPGVDWRPLKPVAKGVIRRDEEPQS